MQISVQVQPHAVPALQGRASPPADVRELRQRLDEFRVALKPLHPDEVDPLLTPHFAVDVPDDEELLARILRILNNSTAVDAAYVKPADELP